MSKLTKNDKKKISVELKKIAGLFQKTAGSVPISVLYEGLGILNQLAPEAQVSADSGGIIFTTAWDNFSEDQETLERLGFEPLGSDQIILPL